MKITLRIPTKDPYAFLEVEFEGEEAELDADQVVEVYEEYTRALNPKVGVGLEAKDFNHALDEYLETGALLGEKYLAMNQEQQNILQCIKRSRARTKQT